MFLPIDVIKIKIFFHILLMIFRKIVKNKNNGIRNLLFDLSFIKRLVIK